ncbi:undecaprenyl/decaprenyl-phosphate alpha-N-acetylglucosaminyl 1-phosphate transferase [Rhizobium sp. CFBP 8762]|uniref:MraY family glycosyltransferase n=1 Tax=Rhizobium sp. CFBP 8762 TaxID=2775279 RepID=UPI00177B0581|nr:MraY family glycosyltransferase [Rhizobium sp. CFBP 8762]MBD8554084.1 undecaprenyl/decaprenyl-phosphate alpha-N-acetylglucosaminyl 1-phosphate transferase [Rhizobium sp. CFBP 8762]
MYSLALSAVLTVFATVVLVMVLRWAAVPLSLLDAPDHRKKHDGNIPMCGGIAMFIAFTLGGVASDNWFGLNGAFWMAILCIVAIGVVDDRLKLPAITRFVVQIVMAVAMMSAAGWHAVSLGLPDTVALPLFVSIGMLVVSVLFIVGLVNAWNMVDGVDGLAGGTATVALIWLLCVAVLEDIGGLTGAIVTLLAALTGFLFFNLRSPWRRRASVFLGDAGSTALGAFIAFIVVVLSSGRAGVPFQILLWMVIVPILDTLSLIARRLIARRNPMSADRWHLHHLLIDSGFTPAMTTALIVLASALLGGIGYLGLIFDLPADAMALGLLLPALGHTLLVQALTAAAKPRFQPTLSSSMQTEV